MRLSLYVLTEEGQHLHRRPPAWLIMVVGGLAAGVFADLWLRHQQRRQAAAGAGAGPDAVGRS